MENNASTVSAKVTPKDFFLNLGWVVTLYGSVISLLNLLFATIDRAFPDVVNQYAGSGYSTGIRWAIAWLIVLFPIYILLTRYLRRGYVVSPEKREIWVRKWFVYLTLFLSSVTVVVDLIVAINSFLGGELTTRFFLKVLATFVVACAIFGYYFYDLKKEGVSGKTGKIFVICSLLVVLASLVWAFSVIGSPMTERLRRFDDQRISGLQEIQWQVISYWQAKGKLPNSLGDLTDDIAGFTPTKDPKTGESYSYEKLALSESGAPRFQLCAKFDLESEIMPRKPQIGENWDHLAGDYCFVRTVDKEIYPVKPVYLK